MKGDCMIKLYFNKLLTMICFAIVFLAIYLIGFSLASVLTNLVVICRMIFLCIATISCLIIAYKLRVKNITAKTKYITTDNTFLKDIIYTLKSREYIAELLSLETICIPIFIYAAISENTPFMPFVIGTLALILISICAFSLIDITLWLLVYRRWKK